MFIFWGSADYTLTRPPPPGLAFLFGVVCRGRLSWEAVSASLGPTTQTTEPVLTPTRQTRYAPFTLSAPMEFDTRTRAPHRAAPRRAKGLAEGGGGVLHYDAWP